MANESLLLYEMQINDDGIGYLEVEDSITAKVKEVPEILCTVVVTKGWLR